jgi:lipoate-protein ligase B
MLHLHDAGTLAYRPAWDLQLQLHEQVLAGAYPEGALMFVQHPPVVTIGRRPGAERHLLVSPGLLALQGVDVVESDRGGDITFHGPGQLVAYPIIPLNRYGLNLHSYMRLLEMAVIDTLAGFGIVAMRDPTPGAATGVWVEEPRTAKYESRNDGAPDRLAKICALGIKVRRWITFHGIALNVTTDLSYFDLINPCGLSRPVTSVRKLLGDGTPGMDTVKASFASAMVDRLLKCPAAAMNHGGQSPLE